MPLAEFVDNSLESFLRHRAEVGSTDGNNAKLRVDVTMTHLTAARYQFATMPLESTRSEYQRAFRLAEPPPHLSGLSEFGMGMKSAACWFGQQFSVRSSALESR